MENQATGEEGDYFSGETARTCLRDGYKFAASFDDAMTVRAQCFMTSSARRDDTRMTVFKETENLSKRLFSTRTIGVGEREDMVGYPSGYVEAPRKWTPTYFYTFCDFLTIYFFLFGST